MKSIFLTLFLFVHTSKFCICYNAKDLNYHADCLVNAIITDDEMDQDFIKRNIAIRCSDQDVLDSKMMSLSYFYSNFVDNDVVKHFESEECIKKFILFYDSLTSLNESLQDDKDKVACVFMCKEVTRILYGMLYSNLDTQKKKDLESEKNNFLKKLENKVEDNPIKELIMISSNPVVDTEKIHDDLPFTKNLNSDQLQQIFLRMLKDCISSNRFETVVK